MQKVIGSGATAIVRNITAKVANVGSAIKGTAIANDIDGANQAVVDFVSAYRDGDNNGGYAFLSGQFVQR